METIEFLRIVSNFSLIAPLFVGLYFFRRLDSSLKLVVLYFILSAVIDVISYYLGSIKHLKNHWLANIYILAQYGLLTYIFSLWHVGRIKVWLRISIVLYALVWGFKNLISGSLTTFDNLSLSLSSSLLVGIALYTLLSFQDDQSNRLLKEPQFWVSAIVLIFFGGNLFVHVFEPTAQTWAIRNGLSIFANLSYALGFLWTSRKSILAQ